MRKLKAIKLYYRPLAELTSSYSPFLTVIALDRSSFEYINSFENLSVDFFKFSLSFLQSSSHLASIFKGMNK